MALNISHIVYRVEGGIKRNKYKYFLFDLRHSMIPQNDNFVNKSSQGGGSRETQPEDSKFDFALRPKSFDNFIGQEKIKKNLDISIEAAKKRGESLDHVLFYGPAGLGKTTLAHIIAAHTSSNIKVTTGPAVEKVGDLASILTNLENGDILFIDEAHRLNKAVEEILYPAMEDYVLDIIIGKGPSARTLRLELPKFTLICATTRIGLLTSPFRSRFGNIYCLEFYSPKDIKMILERSCKILGVEAESKALEMIANSSRQTPRVANRLIKRARDYAQVYSNGVLSEEVTRKALGMLEIDSLGLEPSDRKLLLAIIEKFDGGPVGIESLAAAISEESDTITDIYEPFLMQLGFMERTPRGRVATKLAYEHLGKEYKGDNSLF